MFETKSVAVSIKYHKNENNPEPASTVLERFPKAKYPAADVNFT
jgi:hypothetical protein